MLVNSQKAVITTPHRAASEAGAQILSRGGTAIDAMIAASAVLSVVFPHMTGIGGDALWMLYDNKVRSIMGFGQSARLPPVRPIALRGPDALALTSGAIASWDTALNISQRDWGSRYSVAPLLEEAEALARQGVPVSNSHAFWIQQRRSLLDSLPLIDGLTKNADGDLLKEGDIFYQESLAKTFSTLANNGLMDFYHGNTARQLAEGFQSLGSTIGLEDLGATKADEISPLSIRYRSGRLFNFPPPSQGMYTLKALSTLNHYPIHEFENGGVQYFHLMVEAIKQALLERNRYLHDPAVDSREYHNALTPFDIDMRSAAAWHEPGRPADTIWMAATDVKGRTACLMQSLFHDFGSGCVIGDTGVLWQNRAAGFNADPHHVNSWKPGMRPAHTLNPACYVADDGKQFFFGSQGGDGQPQTLLVLATQLIDYGKNVEEALRASRFLLGRSFFDSTDNLKLESSISREITQGLEALGHIVEMIPSLSPYCGQAGIIERRVGGELFAMHDTRGQGVTLAVD